MAQKLSPFTGKVFIDSNGVPRSGAKLFIYDAGTSSKATGITSDSTGSVNHTNPIILNVDGEIADTVGAAKAIWQADITPVKFVLAPSGDTDPPIAAIDSWDNIIGINDTDTIAQDQWILGVLPTYISATSFTLVGDLTSDYHVGRRVKTTNSGGTIYSLITATAFTSLTTVTVVNDSGSLDSGLSAVSYSMLTSENPAVPGDLTKIRNINISGISNLSKGSDIASSTALTLGSDGNYFDVTGTTAITSINTVGIGVIVKLHFDGILTLTYNATDLILPSGANITTAAGDEAEFVEYAIGDWRCVSYIKADGTPVGPLTTRGDIITRSATDNIRLAVGAANTVLKSDGTDPSWGTVGQGELTSTSGEASTASASLVNLTLPGGAYGFYPRIKMSDTGNSTWQTHIADIGGSFAGWTSYITNISMTAGAGGGTITAEQTYIQASPPYDLGDGEIPLFVFLVIDKTTKDIISTYAAQEAPWHYNGKTSIIASRKDGNRSWKNIKEITAELDDLGKTKLQAVSEGIYTMSDIADRLITDKTVEIELTQAIKNADMSDIPHPFLSGVSPDQEVVLLDPVSLDCLRLAELKKDGEEISDIIRGVSIGSEISRTSPVKTVSFRL